MALPGNHRAGVRLARRSCCSTELRKSTVTWFKAAHGPSAGKDTHRHTLARRVAQNSWAFRLFKKQGPQQGQMKGCQWFAGCPSPHITSTNEIIYYLVLGSHLGGIISYFKLGTTSKLLRFLKHFQRTWVFFLITLQRRSEASQISHCFLQYLVFKSWIWHGFYDQ